MRLRELLYAQLLSRYSYRKEALRIRQCHEILNLARYRCSTLPFFILGSGTSDMRLFQKGWKILTEDGLSEFYHKLKHFIQNKIQTSVEVFYSWIAKKRSPLEYHGIYIPTDSDIFDPKVRSWFLRSDYEIPEKNAIDGSIKDLIEQPLDVVDLGASTGFLTAYTITNLNGNINAVAVEGNPELIPILEDVKKMNGLDFNIENSAYHSSKESVEFTIHNLTVGGSIQRKTTTNTVEVPAINMKQLLKKYNLESFICIVDIEGGEADLINNELDVLEKNCKILIVEFHEGYTKGVSKAKLALEPSEFDIVEESDGIRTYINQGI